VATLSFAEARALVIDRVTRARVLPAVEAVRLDAAAGRVLAEDVFADRDIPAAARSVRDGFAIQAADVPGELRITGEVRAGESFGGRVNSGDAIEIMTGATLPEGADSIVMVEHVIRSGDRVRIDRAAEPGQFINPQGCEARGGERVLEAGKRLGFAEVALLAAVGREPVRVYARPRAAILATGDEIVPVAAAPSDHQIRNSNAYSLAAQVARAGGATEILPVAKDTLESTRASIERGLESDLLLLSGGVSAGKYDLVEQALADLGAEFFFDRVLIQPGQPLVFGRARGKFFFGLPGNPASTMVTFEIFARAALELLGGQAATQLPLAFARLARPFRHKTGLTRFLPACLSGTGELTPLGWSGSGDVPALTRANAFLVADAAREEWNAGEFIQVLHK
jgi:molybdopterin molybdotransferase